jgi:arabinose-5-phosphate isomerase
LGNSSLNESQALHGPELIEVAREVLRIEAAALTNAALRLDQNVVAAVDLIFSRVPGGKVIVLGVGKSGHIGEKIAATLASTGTPAFFVHPTEAGHGDLGMIAPNDVVIAISYSGKSNELLSVLPYFKRNGIPMIGFCADSQSPLGRNAAVWIDCKVSKEACPLGLAPTASTTLTLAMGDAIAICLLRKRGLTPEQFAATHPHGALGRRLLVSVRDIMLSGSDLPVVQASTTVRECLSEMSRGSIGITAVLDSDERLIGVFTDGDLRRLLRESGDVLALPVSAAMGPEPKTIGVHELAVAAADVMTRYKVNAVLVTDDTGNLQGAINMRMLLQAGVI